MSASIPIVISCYIIYCHKLNCCHRGNPSAVCDNGLQIS